MLTKKETTLIKSKIDSLINYCYSLDTSTHEYICIDAMLVTVKNTIDILYHLGESGHDETLMKYFKVLIDSCKPDSQTD